MEFRQFLDKHWDGKSPLLIGYSGGPDSKTLLYKLLDWGRAPLHLAHVDHGWRAESKQEAKDLAEEAAFLKLPFHSLSLTMEKQSNLEEKARHARLAFFRSLFSQIPFQAVLLGHQRDDLAETALKRLLEGAHLPFLGMKPISFYEGLSLWRPLLGMRRTQILTYLKKRNLSYFSDPTNQDPAYLRSRMRLRMFPYLNELLGKKTEENLSLLAERSHELQEYLEKKLFLYPILQDEKGICLDLRPLERLEARYLLQKYTRVPRQVLEKILDGASFEFQNISVKDGYVRIATHSLSTN